MKKKIILILALLCAVFASLTVDTLSSYTSASSSSVSISPDLDKLHEQAGLRQAQEKMAATQAPSANEINGQE